MFKWIRSRLLLKSVVRETTALLIAYILPGQNKRRHRIEMKAFLPYVKRLSDDRVIPPVFDPEYIKSERVKGLLRVDS